MVSEGLDRRAVSNGAAVAFTDLPAGTYLALTDKPGFSQALTRFTIDQDQPSTNLTGANLTDADLPFAFAQEARPASSTLISPTLTSTPLFASTPTWDDVKAQADSPSLRNADDALERLARPQWFFGCSITLWSLTGVTSRGPALMMCKLGVTRARRRGAQG